MAALEGRPRAPAFIVDPNSILSLAELHQKNYTMRDLFIGRDKRQALEWLARHRLVRNSFLCADCNVEFCLNKRESGIDGYRWQCSGCKKQRSVREGSFFSRSHLPLESIIIIMYGFARDFPQNIIAIEAGGLSGNTVVDWMSFCRDVCEQWLEDNSVEIGGLDENGEPKVVEIGESKFIRGVPNSDFCRIRIFCRIHFAESEYSAEHSALPNNEENMFNQASVQCRCSIKQVTLYR